MTSEGTHSFNAMHMSINEFPCKNWPYMGIPLPYMEVPHQVSRNRQNDILCRPTPSGGILKYMYKILPLILTDLKYLIINILWDAKTGEDSMVQSFKILEPLYI